MPKVLTNRRVQIVAGSFIVSMLVFVMASMGFAGAVRSSSAKASSFLKSSRSSKVYSADGKLIANLHGEFNRDPVPLDDIPKHLRRAAIAIEDRRFYSHSGIDLRGTARAFLNNIRNDDQQGGSTITQQLSKNLYFHGEPRTLWRKASEAVLALGMEGKADKNQILESYLNTAYFGRGAYGVQTAARSYFHKDVGDLLLAESAFLAGLIHMPGRYDFTTGGPLDEQSERRKVATTRRNVVLNTMVDVGYITRAAAAEAKRESVDIHPPKDPRWQYPYFIDALLRDLGVLANGGEDRPTKTFSFLGDSYDDREQAIYRGGLRIYTSMDTRAQRNAEASVREHLPKGTHERLSTALVSVEPGTGFVRALIGGRDYYPTGCEDEDDASRKPVCRHAKVNLALGSLSGGSGRHPGSSYKTIVLAAALEDGLSLRQTLDGSPFAYRLSENDQWKVENYEGSAGGTMSVVDATVRSVNAAYARLEIQFLGDGKALVGSKKVAATSRKLGIDFPTEEEMQEACGDGYLKTAKCTPVDRIPAIALGAVDVSPLEMAAAYATFANDGIYAKPTFVTKITDADGKILYTAKPQTHRAVSELTAKGVSHVLQQVIQRGTGRNAALPRPAAGKTGTSQAWRDAWFSGYVPQLATSVWIGNPKPVQSANGSWGPESMTPANGYGIRITGGSYPARIWAGHMAPTVERLPVRNFPEAPQELFKPPKQLTKSTGLTDLIGESGIDVTIRLKRSGRNVVVHRACPPGGGTRGITVWKQEQRGDETHIWRSRAVCR